MTIPELVERKFLFDSNQPITAPLYEIAIARNGVFKRARRREMTAVIKLSAFSARIKELAIEEARIEMTAKIPGRIFAEILAHTRHATDAACFTENLYAVYFDDGQYVWKEISRQREFGSTIARDDDAAYQAAVLEIHTHPPGCRRFSLQDNRDESGKFRLFGVLVDIHSEKSAIRLRIGIYDSFWEFPAEFITDELPLEITDLVKQENAERDAAFGCASEIVTDYTIVREYFETEVCILYENL